VHIDGHVGAFLRETLGDGLADSAAGARDECDFAF
jgi:hypothetical protein